jgi:hypothetical protein
MKERKLLLALSLCGLSALASAESDYERYMKSQMGDFRGYVSAMNSQFAAHLQQQWQEFQSYKANQLYKEPKIATAPQVQRADPESDTTAPQQT